MTAGGSEEGVSAPLRVEYSEPAEAELADAYRWMQRFGLDTAEKWLSGLEQRLEKEAGLLASVTLRRPTAPETSASSGREVFALLYRTGKRGSSPWHVEYELRDMDDDGAIDTLMVLRIRHASRSGEAVEGA